MKRNTTTTRIPRKLHKELKILAVKKGMTMQDLLTEIITTYKKI